MTGLLTLRGRSRVGGLGAGVLTGLAFVALACTPLACSSKASVGPSGTVTTADSSLRPRPVVDGWLFSYRAPTGTTSVHLAGEFNGWSMTAWPMSDTDHDGIWTRSVPLEAGRAYQYKFVVNGSEWVTDPFAETTDPNNYNNGILYTRRPGEAYLTAFLPADGSRLTKAERISALVELEGQRVTSAAIHLSDYLGRHQWDLAADWNAARREISAPLPDSLPDGDYLATLGAVLADGPALSKTVAFSLDRWTGRVHAPPFYDGAVLYEIFVRSFKDGRGADGVGDFAGLSAMLDYLNDGRSDTDTDLGVDALWLMPVHPSPSPHGYDITDYEDIHPDYGTLDEYRRFVGESHRRGMRVMLDYVVNHSSNQHPYFKDAYRNNASPYSGWYKFNDAGNTAYTSFAGYGGMPELNFRSAPMRNYLEEMARFWMDLDGDGDFTDGVDGFRCDVGKGPPHDFWRELRQKIKAWRPDVALLGEVWDNAPTIASYFHDQYDMQFDYPLYYATLDLLNGKSDPTRFLRDYQAIRAAYPPGAQLVRFLDNHDNNRIGSLLGGDLRREKMASGLLLALPGTPLIYYGMEVGMQGVKPDPDIRRPMRWDLVEAQTGDPNSLLSWHRTMIRLRRALPALGARDDDATPSLFPGESDAPGLLVFERRAPGGGPAALVVANVTGQERTGRLTLGAAGALLRGRWRERAASGLHVNSGEASLDLARGWGVTAEPYGFAVYELTPE